MSTHGTLRRRIRTRALALLAITATFAAGLTLSSQPAALGQTLTIPEIQGEAHISPFVGDTVTATGIVTAVAFTIGTNIYALIQTRDRIVVEIRTHLFKHFCNLRLGD